jgi:hypothetical protein
MTEHCRFEPQARSASSENRWTDALREHVKTCEECAMASLAAPFMARYARADERRHKLPDPSVVWLKAQLLGGIAVADRVARPLNVMQMVAYLVVAAGWATLLTWKWNDLQRWAVSLTPSGMAEGLAGSGASLSISVLGVLVMLATVTVVLAFHTILAEE